MKRCNHCGRDISHRIKPGPGRTPTYCDCKENPTCNRERAAKRKRDERHRRIQRDRRGLGRIPRGHYYLPGPVLRATEDVGRIDWECFLVAREKPIDLVHERAKLPDRKRVEQLDARADWWLERGGPE